MANDGCPSLLFIDLALYTVLNVGDAFTGQTIETVSYSYIVEAANISAKFFQDTLYSSYGWPVF